MNYLQRKRLALMRNMKRGILKYVSGYPVTIADAIKGRADDYKIYGNSVQDGVPTPDNPVEIQSVGDLVTDENNVNFGKYKIPVTVSGKNLFNPNNVFNAYMTAYEIRGAGTHRSVFAKIIPGKTYTISKISGARFLAAFTVDYPAAGGSYFSPVGGPYEDKVKTLVAPQNANYLVAWVWAKNNDILTEEEMLASVQIEESNTQTEYEPYKEPEIIDIYLDEPLRKIGDYSDYIDFKNKIVVRNIYCQEDWSFLGNNYSSVTEITTCEGASVYYSSRVENPLVPAPINTAYTCQHILCNKLVPGVWAFSKVTEAGACYVVCNNSKKLSCAFLISDSKTGILDTDTNKEKDIKYEEYIKSINPKIYYPLAEPIEEAISIPPLKLENGTNIISIDTGIEPSAIGIKYYAKE